MKKRVLTGFLYACVIAVAFASKLWTPYLFDILIAFLAIGASIEMARVLERVKKHPYFETIGIYTAVVYLVLHFAFDSPFSIWWLPVYVIATDVALCFVSMIVSLIFFKATKEEMEKHGEEGNPLVYILKKGLTSLQVMMYPGLMFALLFVINHLPEIGILGTTDNVWYDWYLLVSVFTITTATDTLAMLTGMLLKGPKLCPRISPKKTISGAIGGLVGGILASVVTYICFMTIGSLNTFMSSIGFTIWWAIGLGLVGSVMCQIGDIVASWFKRRSRVKDYGTIFPGHGGVLDRVDGLIFTTIVVFLVGILIL